MWMPIRIAAALSGVVVLVMITDDLMDGEISYGLGEIEERVTSNSFAEAFSLWSAFSALCCGLIIFGIKPEIYVERPLLLKVLLAIIFTGYVAGSVLR